MTRLNLGIKFLKSISKLVSGKYCDHVNCHSSYPNMESIKVDDLSIEQRYNDVIKVLNSLQSNTAVLSKIKPSKACQAPNIELTNKYLKRCNIDIDKLNGKVIHVSGTKGKGSTCALTEAILRSHNYTTGFYSSPHLFSVTERIRINGKPLPYDLFIKYFWEIYQMLYNNKDDEHDMPSYFKFLTVMAFKVFISENVDVAIVEVGIGGEYDCTNTLRKTSVVGVTSLGYDHMNILGNTIEEIAWSKAGIMKEDCLAFTCNDQPPSALEVLKDRSKEKKCTLFVVDRKIDLSCLKTANKLVELNSSLAIQLSHAWMHIKNNSSHFNTDAIQSLDDLTKQGLESYVWPGRFQIVPRGGVTFYLDGAHTYQSMAFCIQWFKEVTPKSEKKVLVFNLTGLRDSQPLLELLNKCGFGLACFCPNLLDSEPLNDNVSMKDSSGHAMNVCSRNAISWKNVSGQEGKIFTSVSETISYLSSLGQSPLHVLVTGSLHLVGNTTCYLLPDLWKSG